MKTQCPHGRHHQPRKRMRMVTHYAANMELHVSIMIVSRHRFEINYKELSRGEERERIVCGHIALHCMLLLAPMLPPTPPILSDPAHARNHSAMNNIRTRYGCLERRVDN